MTLQLVMLLLKHQVMDQPKYTSLQMLLTPFKLLLMTSSTTTQNFLKISLIAFKMKFQTSLTTLLLLLQVIALSKMKFKTYPQVQSLVMILLILKVTIHHLVLVKSFKAS